LTLDSKAVRNSIAQAGLDAAKKASPRFFQRRPRRARLNRKFRGRHGALKDCDLVIEAVVENLEIKRKLYAEVERHRRAGSVIASNTSGIPIRQIAENFSEDFRAHFLGIHFFNPPRYLHLCELIPTEWTKPEVACAVFGFLDQRLGKGVVIAKDRPNFIANRIGTYGALVSIKTMLEDNYTIEEVDKMTGQAMGRPKSATFRTFDIVGLDVFAHVAKNLYEAVPEDEEREVFVAPEFLQALIGRGFSATRRAAAFIASRKARARNRKSGRSITPRSNTDRNRK
jgi:3-hydroxyacyl-CoA dehydrogenase